MNDILNKLQKYNIGIKVINDQIQLDVPKGVNVIPLLEEIKSNKEQLILHLERIKNIIDKGNSLRYKYEKENCKSYMRENDRNYYEIFHQQEKEYIRYKIIGKVAFNIAFTIEFENIEIPIIEKTLTTVFKRHESLRTQYKFINGVPMQYILDDFKLPIAYYDLRKRRDKEILLPRIFKEAMNKSFDLEAELCAFVTLIKYSKKSNLIFTIHHANSDYNSIAIIREEILTLYKAYKAKRDNPLAKLKVQYRHYAQWVNSMINSEEGIQMKSKYLAKIKASISGSVSENLAGFLKDQKIGYKNQLQNELNEFLIDNQGEIKKRAFGKIVNLVPKKGARYSITIDIRQLETVANRYKVSSFIILLSSFVLTFYRFSHKKHVRIFVPFSTRVVEEFELIVGWLTSVVVLCLEVSSNLPLEQFIKYVAKEFFAFSEYRFYPHEEILKDLDISLDILAPIFINYIKYSDQILNNFTEGHKEDSCHFNMGMTISEYENEILIDIRYNLDTYSKVNIERFALLYKETLTKMLENNSMAGLLPG